MSMPGNGTDTGEMCSIIAANTAENGGLFDARFPNQPHGREVR